MIFVLLFCFCFTNSQSDSFGFGLEILQNPFLCRHTLLLSSRIYSSSPQLSYSVHTFPGTLPRDDWNLWLPHFLRGPCHDLPVPEVYVVPTVLDKRRWIQDNGWMEELNCTWRRSVYGIRVYSEVIQGPRRDLTHSPGFHFICIWSSLPLLFSLPFRLLPLFCTHLY